MDVETERRQSRPLTDFVRSYKSKPVGVSPAPSSRAISRSMRSNRAKGTGPELVLSRELGRKLMKSTLPGSPDFVYPSAKLAVFVQGCFWHGCPKHYKPPKTHAAFWRRKFARNVERDRLNREELQSMGWKVMEIWEHEVKDDPKASAEKVFAALGRPRTSGHRRRRRRLG